MPRTVRFFVLSVVCTLILAGCGGAGQSVDETQPQPLLLTPTTGDVYEVQSTLDQTIEMTIMGQTVEILQIIREDAEIRVDTVFDDGGFGAQVTSTRFRLSQEGPDSFEEFDSDDPDATPQSDLAVGMAGLANVPLQMRISPVGQVVITEGMDALYNNMADLAGVQSRTQRDTIRAYFRETFPPEDLAQDYESAFYAYTSRPVAPGSTWTVTSATSLLVPTLFDGRLRLDSLAADRVFVSGQGDVRSLTADSVRGTIEGPFRDVDLSGSRDVQMELDRRTGFPLLTRREQTVSGSGLIRSGSRELNVQVSLTSTFEQEGTVAPAPDSK
ncbi:DUF6263 family protein [Longibacter sp.]|jgi:hypothetical protein|uniref:DUF6263 family protein n=1 Tax=Longibacter sp. TaxID=2045415 RepID=UPI003EB91F15